MSWTPANGSAALAHRVGLQQALGLLRALLDGSVRGEGLMTGPYPGVLADIGDGHATALMEDPTGARLVYWPRVWAARSMSYIGDESLADSLVAATSDEHWRVRMMAIQSLGRLGIGEGQDRMIAALDDDHPRVRSAALVALGRVGDEKALGPLQEHLDDQSRPEAVERALDSISARLL